VQLVNEKVRRLLLFGRSLEQYDQMFNRHAIADQSAVELRSRQRMNVARQDCQAGLVDWLSDPGLDSRILERLASRRRGERAAGEKSHRDCRTTEKGNPAPDSFHIPPSPEAC